MQKSTFTFKFQKNKLGKISVGAKNVCSEFMKSQLEPANCLGVKNFAEIHHCEALRKAANQFIHKHFVNVIQCEEFLQLESHDLEELIQNDNIMVRIFQGSMSR